MSEKIIVLDFGGQYKQLIARRVRENHVYCEILPYTTPIEKLKEINPKGIILTGGPDSVYLEDSLSYDPALFSLGIPVLGICYGAQLMAYLLKDELADVDIDKIIRMCLIHDLGEAVTGDIPTFEKTQAHEQMEKEALDGLLRELPEPMYEELTALLLEMEALKTREAKVYKALDKLEAVIQHNESDISTWLPLEYELQKTYAAKNVIGFPFLEKLQEQAVKDTDEKIREKEGNR